VAGGAPEVVATAVVVVAAVDDVLVAFVDDVAAELEQPAPSRPTTRIAEVMRRIVVPCCALLTQPVAPAFSDSETGSNW
jgi:hypothetical protein